MSNPPRLIDIRALSQNRSRARANGAELFLQHAVADEIKERLTEVNRTFTKPAIVSGWPEIWANQLPNATFVDDTEVLALSENTHDLIIHSLSLHWTNDPIGQLIQCGRALVPDGLLICTVFGGQTLHELRTALATAESEVSNGLSPRVLPMAGLKDLGAVLQRSGLALPVADITTYPVTYATPLALMKELRSMGEGNALQSRARHFTRAKVFERACEIYLDAFASPDGRIPATFDVVTLTGWAPSPIQQQPLSRGSANTRLSDALRSTSPSKD